MNIGNSALIFIKAIINRTLSKFDDETFVKAL
jgi:hypothetical protein